MKIYLACPYSHPDPAVREARVLEADKEAAKLMEAGHVVFSPLSHSHPISKYCNVDPTDNDFWLRQDLPWMSICDCLEILPLDGWHKSKGISTETREADRLGIPIHYLRGEELWA